MNTADCITGQNIEKKFGKFHLSIEELHIPQGFATALIGENGAGKSTLFNILSGVRVDGKGTLDYFQSGKGIEEEGIKDAIGFVTAKNYFLPHWTSKNVREINTLLFSGFSPERFDKLCREMALDQDAFMGRGKKVSSFSDGNVMKLMLAGVFARDTKLLLLDEPASPLDPLMRDKLCDMIRRYITDGMGERSVFFSTHNISDMEYVTDYAIILEQGKIMEQGFVEDLKESYRLIKGDAKDLETVSPYLLTVSHNAYGFEGMAKDWDPRRFADLDLTVETPSLYQISVAVMKQTSAVQF